AGCGQFTMEPARALLFRTVVPSGPMSIWHNLLPGNRAQSKLASRFRLISHIKISTATQQSKFGPIRIATHSTATSNSLADQLHSQQPELRCLSDPLRA